MLGSTKNFHRMIDICWRYLSATGATSVLLAFAVASILSACAQAPPRDNPEPESASTDQEAQPEELELDLLYEWSGNGRKVSRIEIDIDEQKASFYDGPNKIGWSTVASGIPYFSTPRGQFAISEKVVEKRSNLYGKIYDSAGKLVIVNARRGVHRIPPGGKFHGAKMPYFMRLTKGGVGMHGGPIPEPGTPASHGCIRLPHALAPMLYESVSIGTPVRILVRKGS